MLQEIVTTPRGINYQVRLDFRAELEKDPRMVSSHSKRAYCVDLDAFESWLDGRPMSKLIVEQYAAEQLAKGKTPGTVNRALCAIRWWAQRIADITQETTAMDDYSKQIQQDIIQRAERVTRVRGLKRDRNKKAGRYLSIGERTALINICEKDVSPAGARDLAMIALAWSCGLRRDEIASMKTFDITAQDGETEIKIMGKGRVERTAYINNGALDALNDWLAIRGGISGPVFCRVNKGGAIAPLLGLSGTALEATLKKRIREAKIQDASWHDFRRTCVSDLLESGVDLVTVQRLMGHAQPTTTSAYDRRGEETLRRASKVLHVPYCRREMVTA